MMVARPRDPAVAPDCGAGQPLGFRCLALAMRLHAQEVRRGATELETGPTTFPLRVGPYPSARIRPDPSWLLRSGTDSIQCRPVVPDISSWVATPATGSIPGNLQ